ncbi:MAG TPA: hypothetical protein VMG09_04660 [Bacteroidota bacterium]|nr:hypothetical protein [Bacteroidota bacterium]
MMGIIFALEFKRFCARPSWLLLGALILASAPLSLSPYFPRFFPALACGLTVVGNDLMDMFGSRDREIRKLVALPLDLQDVILGKGFMTMVKAAIATAVAGVVHAWLAGPSDDSSQALLTGLGFLATMPPLVHIGARLSIAAISKPSPGVLEPLVRVVLTLLAAAVCGIPAFVLATTTHSAPALAAYAALSLSIWMTVGARGSARRLERWMQSPAYDL